MLPNAIQIVVFWSIQVSALLVFVVPFRWPLIGLWAASHFVRAIGLTLIFHRYLAHRAFRIAVRRRRKSAAMSRCKPRVRRNNAGSCLGARSVAKTQIILWGSL